MILSLYIIIYINFKFYFCDFSKIKILSVKNSIIDKAINISISKEKQKINMDSKKNILEPNKKKRKRFKKKDLK